MYILWAIFSLYYGYIIYHYYNIINSKTKRKPRMEESKIIAELASPDRKVNMFEEISPTA